MRPYAFLQKFVPIMGEVSLGMIIACVATKTLELQFGEHEQRGQP